MPSEGSLYSGPGPDIYSLLINSVQDYAIVLLDTDGTIQSWNKGAEIIKGYKGEEIIGKNFEVFYTAEEAKKNLHKTYLKEALALGHTQQQGWRVRKDGSLFWAHVTISALYDTNNILRGYTKVTCDLTLQKKAEEEKKRNHEILTIISHTARIGTWEVDLATNSISWDKVTKEIHGVSEDYKPTIAQAILFFKEGESRDIITHIFTEAVKHGTPYDIELIITTAQGHELWCRAIGQTEFRNGKCIRLFGTFQDIDLQKRTQIELQYSEEQFRRSFDLSGIGMALVNPNAIPIRVNKKLCEILGYTYQEFYAMSVLDITHPDDIQQDKNYAQQLLSGEIDHYQMTKRYIHKNGSTVWSHITVSLVKDAQKQPLHFVSEVEDITEKKKAEDELKKVNDELTALFNSGIRASIIATDLSGIITHFNKGAEELFGYSAVEIVGKFTPELFYVKDAMIRRNEEISGKFGKIVRGFEALVEPATQDGHESKECIYLRKDGTTFSAYTVVSPIRDEQGKITGYMGISTDITQIKEAEASIRKYALLEAKNKEMEQFTFIASHDLLEPLQTVSSFVGLLTEEYHGKLDENAQKYISFIQGSTRRMMELVKGLLHYSRIGRARELMEVNCNELVRDVIEDLGLLIAENNAKIEVSPLPTLKAYPLELNQLFQNLIRNAIKFKKPDQQLHINISASREKNGWLFVISDNGIGIAEKNREKIFVIFQRLHDRHEYEGTGIGLAYCKKIVELHNGNIWVNSNDGKGSDFYFTLMTGT